MVIDDEKSKLFELVRANLGAPVRKVELTDDQLCNLLTTAIGDYSERVQNFIIEANWATLYGKNISNLDLAFALSVRTLDINKEFSYYFSKEVGLQQRGPWELKKDFFVIEPGKQCYLVPAGREINKVLFITPPTSDPAMFANAWAGGAMFGSGVMGQLGSVAAFNGGLGTGYGIGMGAYALPFYDIALTAADMSYKNKFLQCDLAYKVTAGPDGSHIIHLMSAPGGLADRKGGFGRYHNCYCWYTYYEPDDVDECRKNNPDILLSPDQVPLGELDYALFNNPTKQIIRQLLIANAAITLGFIRGKFSGSIQMISSPLTMDYQMLISFGTKEKENALKTLDERLDRMTPWKIMENNANLTENLIKSKKGTPLGIYVR